jgi:hypothetical protein
MNSRILEALYERPDFPIGPEDKKMLDWFSEYLDHGSLFLLRFEPGDDPRFTFANDAQHYHFRLSDVRKYYTQMKSGIPMDWENIPFEYITKA